MFRKWWYKQRFYWDYEFRSWFNRHKTYIHWNGVNQFKVDAERPWWAMVLNGFLKHWYTLTLHNISN